MKKIITTAVFCCAVILCFAQQEQQYTQFMYNKLSFNPGYAGSYDAPCITAIYRNQWIGLDGAPKTITVSFDAPLLNKRVGVGLNLTSRKIGIQNRINIDGAYSYRVRLGRGTLGLGVQGSIRYISNDYSDTRLSGTQAIETDGGIPVGEQSKMVPNFGAGLYYHTPKFYLGVSVPRLLKNNIDFNDISGVLGKEVEHVYAMAGLLIDVSKTFKLQPQLLVKYADNSPLDADLNLSAIFNEKYTFGVTYRAGSGSENAVESIDLLLSAYVTDNVMFGLSYDIGLTELKDYNSGSLEAILRYCFGKSEGEDIVNPRFF
ncbi:MAG: type IX secretion system membrane protein PorP/SprF [Bacteroidota bacterium]